MRIFAAITMFMLLFVGCSSGPSDDVIAYLEVADALLSQRDDAISRYSIELERMNQDLIDYSLDWNEYNWQYGGLQYGLSSELGDLFKEWLLLQHPLDAANFHSAVQKLLLEQWFAAGLPEQTNFGLWPLTESPGDRERRVDAARNDVGKVTIGTRSLRDAVADERRSLD